MAEGDRDELARELATGELEDFVLVTILAKGNTIEYVVPSFPVFAVDLVEVKLPLLFRVAGGIISGRIASYQRSWRQS